jgi:hypothetical protein
MFLEIKAQDRKELRNKFFQSFKVLRLQGFEFSGFRVFRFKG